MADLLDEGKTSVSGADLDFPRSDRTHRWRPVSREFPVHIRPLASGGVEVALYLPESLSLYEAVWGPRSGHQELVRKVAETIAASLGHPSGKEERPESNDGIAVCQV